MVRLVYIGLMAALPLAAAAAEPWSVDALVERVLAVHPELRHYEAGVAVARGQRTQAGLWKNPEVSAEVGQRRTTSPDGAVEEGFSRGFSLTQTFEFPGKASLRKALAAQDVEHAEWGLRQFRRSLEGKVRLLALRHEVGRTDAAAAREVGARGAALVALLRQRPAAGAAQFLEMRLIEAGLLGLQQEARESERMREEARLELNTLLGLPPNQPLEIRMGLEAPARGEADLDRLILAGLGGSPALKMREVELRRAVNGARAARLEAAPDFAVGPFFSQEEAGEREETVGVSVSTALPVWNWNQGGVAAADARKAQADALLEDARARVQLEIARRFRGYERSRAQHAATPADLVDRMREAAELADRQYRTGAIGVRLFLDVQSEYLGTRKRVHETLLEMWEHWLDLDLLTGGVLSRSEGGRP